LKNNSEKVIFGKVFGLKDSILEHFSLFKKPSIGFTWEQWRCAIVSNSKWIPKKVERKTMKSRTHSILPLLIAVGFYTSILNASAGTLITEYEDQSSSASVCRWVE
jgi:hypothetical protein